MTTFVVSSWASNPLILVEVSTGYIYICEYETNLEEAPHPRRS